MKELEFANDVGMSLSISDSGISGEQNSITLIKRDGRMVPLDHQKLKSTISRIAKDLLDVSVEDVEKEIFRNLQDGMQTKDFDKLFVLVASGFIERSPEYNVLSTRFLKQRLYKEVFGKSVSEQNFAQLYRETFITNLTIGVVQDYFDKRLLDYDLEFISQNLKPECDELFGFMGLHTLYERYFLKIDGRRLETPQAFWMRIAMGLALNEKNPQEHVLEFYEILSTLRYVPSTPTLFHSGMKIPQLSSCFLSTVTDDLSHIFKCIGDNAQLAKWAGGLGTDWTGIRATGSFIKGIKATSQGVVPFLKIANDVVVAITKSGIRRGGTCAYLEAWHLDIELFLDLRRNTGDERMRTHDMNTASWIPDLFMKRVLVDKDWTLFSPDEVPDLHELFGKAFEERYEHYEKLAHEGKMRQYKTISAKALWRKMLTRLFETGHPWLTFKDPCNVRSPQDHVGVVHSSNLCTEITLNTSASETAVCNLGSINFERHVMDGKLNEELLKDTVKKAIRMLDNVIDLNFYPTQEAKNSNYKHRPIGLGVMGFQDLLFKLDIPFTSEDALIAADLLGEKVSYYAISASCELAAEKGAYESYKGSKWDRGIFPLDTVDLLEKERGMPIEVSRTYTMDWNALKANVKKYGMRNSNVMAIAPTATISTIAGCSPCIEPIYKNIFVESNISGEFVIVNSYLVEDLKKRGLWNKSTLDKLKYYDGDISMIDGIDSHLKEKYKTSFDIQPEWLMKITATRGKWIDQSQSHNVFMKGVSGKRMEEAYMAAWKYGMKTTYYFRTLAATQIEKSTLDASTYGFTQKREYGAAAGSVGSSGPQACGIENPECESCQ